MKYDKSSGSNVFEDIGFPAEEAALLRLKSSLMIAAEKHIQDRSLGLVAAAKSLGVDKAEVRKLLGGRFNEFTVETLVTMLIHAGIGVELVCKDSGKKRGKAA